MLGSSVYQYFENWTIAFLVATSQRTGILNLAVLPCKENSLLSQNVEEDSLTLVTEAGFNTKCENESGWGRRSNDSNNRIPDDSNISS